MSRKILFALSGLAVSLAVACTQGDGQGAEEASAEAVEASSIVEAAAFEPTVDDFKCIRDMHPVRGFYVDNLLGDLDGTIAVAEAGSGVYPVGSVVQLVPTEAMIKRRAGYNAATSDWEFFELTVSGEASEINVRGADEVVNQFGGNCLECHAKANPERDMICEQGHGCDPLPLTPAMMKAIQNTDPRCEPIANLPEDQVEALKMLEAFRAAATANQ